MMPQRIEKGGIDEAIAKLKANLEANAEKLAADSIKLEADFEASNAKFNAQLESLAPRKPVSPAQAASSGPWFLARKCWSWLYHD